MIFQSLVLIKLFIRRVMCFCVCTLIMLVSTLVHAHNNVVIIPMVGEDVVADLIPTSEIANIQTNQNNYTIRALTVIDNITQLEWQKDDDNIKRNWNSAWDFCADLDLDNHDDWRLPSIVELSSIIDYSSSIPPLINELAFINTDPDFYWSATSNASNSVFAWVVLFGSGIIDNGGKSLAFFVRCVR